MICMDMPVIIPILATGYLLAIYLLLMLAQRTINHSQYVGNSLKDASTSCGLTEQLSQIEEVEQWSLGVASAASLVPKELSPPASSPSKIQEASSVS